MNRRRFLIVAIGLGAVLLLGAAWHFLRPRSPINRQSFERLKIGMNANEVENILTLPPGDYSRGTLVVTHTHQRGPQVGVATEWTGDDGIVWVFFDSERRVQGITFMAVRQVNLLDRLRLWLGL